MRLIDLDAPETIHLLCNLEPKWKPMAEFNSQTELFEELDTVIDAFNRLPEVEIDQQTLIEKPSGQEQMSEKQKPH